MVLVNAIDATFSSTVHTRTSFTADEFHWNARFVRIFERGMHDGPLAMDISRIHEVEAV